MLERIQGRLPIQIDLTRTVAGLNLPFRCAISNTGLAVGSCSYGDFCKDIVQDMCGFTASNCPPELADWGIDCNCPLDIPAQTVDESSTFDFPDFNFVDYPLYDFCPFFFLPFAFTGMAMVGDWDFKITISNYANQHVACFRFLFTMTKA